MLRGFNNRIRILLFILLYSFMAIKIVNKNLSLSSDTFTTKNGTFKCISTEGWTDTWKHLETGKVYKYSRQWLFKNQASFK